MPLDLTVKYLQTDTAYYTSIHILIAYLSTFQQQYTETSSFKVDPFISLAVKHS